MKDTNDEWHSAYQAIINLVPLGLFVIDQQKKIIEWNKWLEIKTHINRSEAIDHTLKDLFPNQAFSRFDWAVEQAIEYQNPQVMSQSLNKYLIPIENTEKQYQHLKYMRQQTEVHPLKVNQKSYALVTILDVTTAFYEKTDLINIAKKFSSDSIIDPLTQVYNRRYLHEWLNYAINVAMLQDLKIICCVFDIDKFKFVNDTYGHDMGDEAILCFVATIKKVKRADDFLFRLGGDEFILLLLTNDAECLSTVVPERVLTQFATVKHTPNKIALTSSCGVSVWNKTNNAVSEKELIEQADKALYQAKQAGRACFKVFDPLNHS